MKGVNPVFFFLEENYEVGDIVYAKDKGHQFKSKVIKVVNQPNGKFVKVHFIGYKKRWDRTVPVTEVKLIEKVDFVLKFSLINQIEAGWNTLSASSWQTGSDLISHS